MTPKKPQRRPDPRPAGKPIPVLLPEPLLQRLDDVAAIMGISRADALRLAARVGLEDLKRVDYDIAQLVVDAVHKSKIPLACCAFLRRVCPVDSKSAVQNPASPEGDTSQKRPTKNQPKKRKS